MGFKVVVANRGVTLVELLVALAVLSVLLATGVPGLEGLVANHRASAQANHLVAALAFARSEALKSGRAVTLCRSASALAAEPGCGGPGWESGWIIYRDGNANGTREAGEQILQVQGPLAGSVLRYNAMANRVTFSGRGLTTTQGSFSLCHGRRQPQLRSIIVAATGRVTVHRPVGHAGRSAPQACSPE